MTRKHHKMRRTRLMVDPFDSPASKATYYQEEDRAGLLVSKERDAAIEECRARVKAIAADYRAQNRKFRDVEFDLERDRERCLRGLVPPSEVYDASEAQRVTQIFKNPKFHIKGANPNDIIQGPLGDCWFLSALATMSATEGLLQKSCVERDEDIGVYGFVFFRDAKWVEVIIDDFLFTTVPKFEELSADERKLYHDNKETYNHSARRQGKNLHFAKSGAHGETWVPLIEKAYAKLHGSYAALDCGDAGEAVEDMTGGVTSLISTKDIFSADDFWNNELKKANNGRLFGCSFDTLKSYRSQDRFATVNGLIGGHAYSVLRAVEYRGKRFVVLRNPWGDSEWTGRWSDGSKEWTKEWLPALEELKHTFGADGQFVMEYGDFLENWEMIDRTLLFDSTWVMSSQWLRAEPRRSTIDWGYGVISFTFTLFKASATIVVLSKIDERYFRTLTSESAWSFDFVVFKRGGKHPIAHSSPSLNRARSVNVEIKNLDAGDYIVHVRLDRHDPLSPEDQIPVRYLHNMLDLHHSRIKKHSPRIFSRVLTEKLKSQSIASNFDKRITDLHFSTPLETLAGKDLLELHLSRDEDRDEDESVLISENALPTSSATLDGNFPISDTETSDHENGEEEDDDKKGILDPIEEHTIYLGLRVYTHNHSPVKIQGQLRH